MPAAVRSDQSHVRARLDVEYLEGRRLLNAGPLLDIVSGFRSAHVKVEQEKQDHAVAQDHKETLPLAKVKENSSASHGHTTGKDKAADQKDHAATHPV